MTGNLPFHKASISKVLTYTCRTWPIRTEDFHKLEVMDHWSNERIINARCTVILSNDPRQRYHSIQEICALIERLRLQWPGYVLSKTKTEITKQPLLSAVHAGWYCRKGEQLKTAAVKMYVDRFILNSVHKPWRCNETGWRYVLSLLRIIYHWWQCFRTSQEPTHPAKGDNRRKVKSKVISELTALKCTTERLN